MVVSDEQAGLEWSHEVAGSVGMKSRTWVPPPGG
jgi:hypothetical protein